MATPPRSAAEKSLSEPSSRPIGVRAPATMTVGSRTLMADPPADTDGPVVRATIPACEPVPRTPAEARVGAPSSPPIDHVGFAVPTSTPRSRSTRRAFGMRSCTRRSTRSRASGGDGRRRRLRLCIQLLAPLTPGLGDRQVPRPQRRGHPAGGLPGRRRRRACAATCATPACGCSTTPRGAAPPGSRINFVHPKDAGGVLVELVEPAADARRTDRRARVGPCADRYRSVASETDATAAYRTPQSPTPGGRREADPRRDPVRRPPRRRTSPRSPIPESYRAVTVHKDEDDMFDGHADPGQGPAQVAARRRRARCPSSAPARRSSP